MTHLAWWPRPMVLAITAMIGAAGLVLYLQHRAIAALHSQTQVILRQMSEQTAVDIGVELRRTLDGPVFDTLTAVNHPELRAGRLDLIAAQFKEGLDSYPHVDRFFAWNAQTEQSAPGEVLFYRRDRGFERDPALGRAVIDVARRHAAGQQIYVAVDGVGPTRTHQLFLRLFWTDAQRREYFAVLGFVIDPAMMRKGLATTLGGDRIATLLTGRGGDTPLQLRVIDERGATVFGYARAGPISGRVAFPMLFYPADDIRSRLAAGVDPQPWWIEVAAPEPTGLLSRVSPGYWPTALSAMLMLVALGLTVQAHRRSAQLAQMQTEFVAHVSHQLKTPLTLLSAATETLQMDRVRSPERFSEYLATIHAEAARLSLLVQRVLEFSRLQQRRRYEFEAVDLAALAHETVDAFAHGLSSQQVTLRVEQSGPEPYVHADPAALEQVIANLLDNAVKYSAAGKQITVRVLASRAHAVIEVIDEGVGIAAVDQSRIFERFYRASTAAHRPGFGLGLPIVRELVQAHGGRVDVISTLGRGSTFRVTLPRIVTETIVATEQPLETPEMTS